MGDQGVSFFNVRQNDPGPFQVHFTDFGEVLLPRTPIEQLGTYVLFESRDDFGNVLRCHSAGLSGGCK